MKAYEVNFDALVGPTHHYAGLGHGNLASQAHKHQVSNPRQAALEGLRKMKMLADLGMKQAVLPPQERPDLQVLRRLGFRGSDAEVLASAAREDPVLLSAASSASSMWAANAATISPSADTADGRTHLTTANLVSQFHRSLEPPATEAILRTIFPDTSAFALHAALPASSRFADEGAANHTRLCAEYGGRGVELFVYGRDADNGATGVGRYAARQSLQASQAVARLHQLDPNRTLFIRQNPAAIDAGVFHNDVICVGNQNILLCHADAFADGASAFDLIGRAFERCCADGLHLIKITDAELPLADAVSTYLFNSQLVTLPAGGMRLVAPIECQTHPAARACIERILCEPNPVTGVHYVDVRQSMHNGGGPACLRLRVVLNEDELWRTHAGVFLDAALCEALAAWINRYYRETLSIADLSDPCLVIETRDALEELTRILKLGFVYSFQR